MFLLLELRVSGALKQSTLLTMIPMMHTVDPELLDAVQPEKEQCLLHVVVERSAPRPSLYCARNHTFSHLLIHSLTDIRSSLPTD